MCNCIILWMMLCTQFISPNNTGSDDKQRADDTYVSYGKTEISDSTYVCSCESVATDSVCSSHTATLPNLQYVLSTTAPWHSPRKACWSYTAFHKVKTDTIPCCAGWLKLLFWNFFLRANRIPMGVCASSWVCTVAADKSLWPQWGYIFTSWSL